ncbi:MAG: aminodeoxychorismate synthase component I, partial [Bacteroidales bacterium]|nr:aminodeoxychorismate synthase component I [Bacteroidales bacterium]
LKDRFVVFSPESFIKIKNGKIYTYPMKGTAIKENPESAQKLLDDPKESAEHATITDLLRNDLSKVAKNVKVNRYRYIDEINTGGKTILQVSSEISGDLFPEYCNNFGDLFQKILPAGSVTGAPKKKTVEIIKATENYNRGFYTGVFGYFNGESLDSAVMIRYIEKEGDEYFYKSGGGITSMSDAKKEYRELIDKIYVPVH